MNDETKTLAEWLNEHPCHNPTLRWRDGVPISLRITSALVPMDEDEREWDSSRIGGVCDIYDALGLDGDTELTESEFIALAEQIMTYD